MPQGLPCVMRYRIGQGRLDAPPASPYRPRVSRWSLRDAGSSLGRKIVNVSDPIVDAARELLADGLDELRRATADLSTEDLNRRPAGGETNSLAVIATHALAGTRSWLSLATGAPLPPRDRPAEFRTIADAELRVLDRGADRRVSRLAGRRLVRPRTRGHGVVALDGSRRACDRGVGVAFRALALERARRTRSPHA